MSYGREWVSLAYTLTGTVSHEDRNEGSEVLNVIQMWCARVYLHENISGVPGVIAPLQVCKSEVRAIGSVI